jgi:hypothetical protein
MKGKHAEERHAMPSIRPYRPANPERLGVTRVLVVDGVDPRRATM